MPSRKLSKGERGHLQKAQAPTVRHLREFKVKPDEEFQLGQVLDVSLFAPGERVDIVATTKGRGFAGGVRRHGFSGGPKTHGQSDRFRAPGSIGSGTTPGRVYKAAHARAHGQCAPTVSG